MIRVAKKPGSVFLTQNRLCDLSLIFWKLKYYLCSENNCADQLRDAKSARLFLHISLRGSLGINEKSYVYLLNRAVLQETKEKNNIFSFLF